MANDGLLSTIVDLLMANVSLLLASASRQPDVFDDEKRPADDDEGAVNPGLSIFELPFLLIKNNFPRLKQPFQTLVSSFKRSLSTN